MIFTVEGWEDRNGDQYQGTPLGRDLDRVYGAWVKVTDPNDPTFVQYFWAYVPGPFEEWEEWWVYIAALMEMHGMELG